MPQHRVNHFVPATMPAIIDAYRKKDFETFGALTMRDSNQFHAICLDTFPPIFYLNQTSKDIINIVHKINEVSGKIVCAYTFDAGPNAVIYTTKAFSKMILSLFTYVFPIKEMSER